MKMPRTITIGTKDFTFVSARRRVNVTVYKTSGLYLKIGPPKSIDHELAIHRQMDTFGFPVPEVLKRGTHGAYKYFLEKSLGEKHFSAIFSDDFKKFGRILMVFLKYLITWKILSTAGQYGLR